MRRRIVAALALLIAMGATAVLGPATAHAQARPLLDHLDGTTDEVEGWWAVMEGHWVRARELGEKLLAGDADSYAAHYVLGAALHRGEGDLPRALHHLELARKSWEA